MTEKEQASQIKESLTSDILINFDYLDTYLPGKKYPHVIDTKMFRGVIGASFAGIALPRIYSS